MSQTDVVVRLLAQKDPSVSAAAQSTGAEFAKMGQTATAAQTAIRDSQKELVEGTQSLAKAFDGTSTAAGRFVDASGRLREANGRFVSSAQLATEALQGLQTQVDGYGKKAGDAAGGGGQQLNLHLGGLKDMLRGAGIAFGLSEITKEMIHLGQECLQEASSFEQYQQRLEVIGHSASLARAQMAQAVQIASTLPFDVGQVTAATVNLEKFGASADKLLPIAANMAAVMGVDLPAAAQALGKAWDGSEGGVRMLRDEFGITNETLKEHGAIVDKNGELMIHSVEGLTAYRNAILDLGKAWEGGAAHQAQTFAGQLSNLRDAFTLLAKTIGDSWLPQAKYVVSVLTDMARAAREAYEGLHPTKNDNDDRLKKIAENNQKIADLQKQHDAAVAPGFRGEHAQLQAGITAANTSAEIERLKAENQQLKSDIDAAKASQAKDVAGAKADADNYGGILKSLGPNATPAQIMDALKKQGVQNPESDLSNKIADLQERERGALSDKALTKEQRLELAKPYDDAIKSVTALQAKIADFGPTLQKAKTDVDALTAGFKFEKQVKGAEDLKAELQTLVAARDKMTSEARTKGVDTSVGGMRKYLDEHQGTDNDVTQFIHAYGQLSEEINTIRGQVDAKAKAALSEKVHNFTEDINLEKDKYRQQVDLHKMSEQEYARHLTALADKAEAYRKHAAPALEGAKGQGLERGLDTLEGNLRTEAAQAEGRGQHEVDAAAKTAQRAKDESLTQSVRGKLETLRLVHESYEQQQADLKAIQALIESSAASETAKSKALQELSNERMRVENQHVKEQEAAQEHLLSLQEKMENLKLKRAEKDFKDGKIDQTALAAEIQKQTDMEMAAIEAKRQKAIAATGDVASANAEAQEAQMELYSRQSDAVDALMQKQEAAAQKAHQTMTGPLNAGQAVDYLNKGVEGTPDEEGGWYGKGSTLKPFSLDIGPQQQKQDDSPLGQLKAKFDGLGKVTGTLTDAFAALQKSLNTSAPKGGTAPAAAANDTNPQWVVKNGQMMKADQAKSASDNGTPGTSAGAAGAAGAAAGNQTTVTINNYINGVAGSGGPLADAGKRMAKAASAYASQQDSLPKVQTWDPDGFDF